MILSDLLNFGGVTLCGLVGVKMFASVADSLQRYSSGKKRFQLRNSALRQELDRLRRVALSTGETTAWEGFRKFRVHSKVQESETCHSIYFVPHDGKPLPQFHPGQFLTFSVRIPGQTKPAVRCYSLSDSPNGVFYRCTVKKVPPRSEEFPPGLVSNYFNDELKEGDILDVKAPKGGFYLDMTREEPIVLLAGGVGITPLLSMINTVAATGSRRIVHMFCGFTNSDDHLFKTHLERLAENYPNLHIHTVYSKPLSKDAEGKDFAASGYLTLDVLKSKLPSNNFEYYLCGPPPFMNSVQAALKDWGVPGDAIHSEAFGPASIKKPEKPASSPSAVATASQVKVSFARSQVHAAWDSSCENLLDLADKINVAIDSGCRAGNCGTCAVAIRSGSFVHSQEPTADVPDGSCLACIAVPESDLELDA